jgi:hypothetical protein
MSWHDITIAVWIALLAVAVLLEVTARVMRGAVWTLDKVVAAGVSRSGPRCVILVLWMWLGWHAFAR